MTLFQKQPADQLDYDLDFSQWLTDDDTLVGVTATSNVPEEIIIESVSIEGQAIKVWVSGGENGQTYKVTVTVTTTLGRIKELDFKIRVKDC